MRRAKDFSDAERAVIEAIIALSGPAYASVSIREIREITGMPNSTLATVMASLRKKKLIAARDRGGDGIAARYVPTAKLIREARGNEQA